MKKLIKSLARTFGRQKLRKWNKRDRFGSAFQNAFMSLLSCHEKLRVVQLGANDGHLNDPIYDLMNVFANRTEALLIEPQSVLIPFLTANYSFHPHCQIYNGAIGPEGTLRLFSIDPIRAYGRGSSYRMIRIGQPVGGHQVSRRPIVPSSMHGWSRICLIANSSIRLSKKPPSPARHFCRS